MEPRQVFSEYEPLSKGPYDRYIFCAACGSKLALENVNGQQRQRCATCGRIQYHNPLPGAVVLVVDGNRFLLCLRASRSPTSAPATPAASIRSPISASRAGKWCLPGGVIEWREDFITAGIREVKEETGVDVEIDSILTLTSNFFRPDSHTLAVVLLGHAIRGEPHGDGVETDAAQWFSASEPLPDMAFEGDRHIIERYFDAPFAGAPVDPRYAKG